MQTPVITVTGKAFFDVDHSLKTKVSTAAEGIERSAALLESRLFCQ